MCDIKCSFNQSKCLLTCKGLSKHEKGLSDLDLVLIVLLCSTAYKHSLVALTFSATRMKPTWELSGAIVECQCFGMEASVHNGIAKQRESQRRIC